MKPYLFGYYFDWQDNHPFTVLAIVMAESPIEATTKFEDSYDRSRYVGEIDLVGGAVWEAREAPIIQ